MKSFDHPFDIRIEIVEHLESLYLICYADGVSLVKLCGVHKDHLLALESCLLG